jgi:hypothetical protein
MKNHWLSKQDSDCKVLMIKEIDHIGGLYEIIFYGDKQVFTTANHIFHVVEHVDLKGQSTDFMCEAHKLMLGDKVEIS